MGQATVAIEQESEIAQDIRLADSSRAVRWAGPFFAVCALVLIPWTIIVALTLPSWRALVANYNVAWAGFVHARSCSSRCAATAWSVLRTTLRYLASVATCSAALLVTDAWFDVMTAPSGQERVRAIVLACVVELPLAATCLWMAYLASPGQRRKTWLSTGRASPAAPATLQELDSVIEEFAPDVAEAELRSLRQRLYETRWPDGEQPMSASGHRAADRRARPAVPIGKHAPGAAGSPPTLRAHRTPTRPSSGPDLRRSDTH